MREEAFVARAAQLSRYARELIASEAGLKRDLIASLEQPFDAPEMQSALDAEAVTDEAALGAALRRLRKRVMLRLITRDLNGLADLSEVMATTTALAETAIRFSVSRLSQWMEDQYGRPVGADSGTPQDLVVVGMGKLGGGELNVSSDVDLIFVYPEEGDTRGPRALSNHEFSCDWGGLITSLTISPNTATCSG